ncbi:centrosomal protein of 85 kDa isoform X2 [Pseudophryne corroboree]|uniref:centrosomal protein of 85 kDa isoform X2 n=1 Tax=Pseudophryne corroboree TaxID=495146 RepID=UPI003081CDCF
MTTMDRYKDMGLQQRGTAVGLQHTGSSYYTDWQTPQLSGKSLSRVVVAHGIKNGGGFPEGNLCSETEQDSCNASGSTSFQPIRRQVTIPTAHVVPSTLAPSSNSMQVHVKSPVSTEFPFLPMSDPSTVEDNRKFETPNIEPTLNQSGLLNVLCPEGRNDVSTGTINSEVEPYRSLPESTEFGGRDHTRRAVTLATTSLRSQGWRPDTYSLQPGAEYSAWKLQQQQYTDNLRMRMERLQLERDFSTTPAYPVGLHQVPSEWERAVKASETVLMEKEMLLERQRQHISQLEQRLRQSEVQIHSTLLSQSSPYNDMCIIRLQDLQREVTFLRAQFADKTDSSNQEKAELEKKLCAHEAESRGLREAVKEAAQKHAEELKKQDERVKGRERHINSLKKKCQKEAEQNKEKQQRIETLERYLADLPTVQDHHRQLQEMKELQEKNCLLQAQVSDLERKLGEARASYRENDAQLAAEKLQGQKYLNTIESLQKELKKLETAYWREEEKRLTEEAETLRREVETLYKEQECMKKVVESQKKKMEQMCTKVKDLEEQVCQEEGTGQALKEESQQKEAALQQLKAAVKELAVQNQDLMERNVTLQEKLHIASVKTQPAEVEASQLFTLYKEMNHCQKDLRSICCLLSQRVQAVSVLDDQEEALDLFSIERYLNGVAQLKRDIEELRTTISDCYAQDMGDNCITQ